MMAGDAERQVNLFKNLRPINRGTLLSDRPPPQILELVSVPKWEFLFKFR